MHCLGCFILKSMLAVSEAALKDSVSAGIQPCGNDSGTLLFLLVMILVFHLYEYLVVRWY